MPSKKIDDTELKIVKGAVGAKAGLTLGVQMNLLRSKLLAFPVLAGSTIAAFFTGKKTDKKVKEAIKFIKESNVDKATYVFEKMAIGPMGLATGALIAGSLAPKPRKTATSITTLTGKNIKMKKLVNLPKTNWRVKTNK
jgi:hypothetical protein